eukprot:COSAG02_NODE_550_length_20437_cov_4.270676_8_plen_206_part_00
MLRYCLHGWPAGARKPAAVATACACTGRDARCWRGMRMLLIGMVAFGAAVRGQLDECATGVHNCHADAACVDTEDAFVCTCLLGFTGDGQLCDPCGAVEYSTEVSCTDLNRTTVIACASGYFRTVQTGASDACQPLPPAPAPTPAPEPSPADDAELQRDQRESAPFVALTLVLLAAIFVTLLPITCLACRAKICPRIHGVDGSPA